MEVRRLGEPLLRSSPLPLLSFLAPSVSPAWRPTLLPRLSCCISGRDRRLLSAKTGHKAEKSTVTELSEGHAAPQDSIASIFERTQNNQPPSAVSPRTQQIRDTKLQSKINAKLDQMFPSKTDQSSVSSADEVLDAYRRFENSNRAGLRSGSIAGSMLMPDNITSSSTQRQVAASILADSVGVARRNKRTVRSRPAVGRTIEVEPALGTDFGQAIKKLSILLVNNKVRQDLRKQKYHERAGAKRKRLKSERWRSYFKAGFQATVTRVKKMRRQGW